jgi:hypothetical protein
MPSACIENTKRAITLYVEKSLQSEETISVVTWK